MEKRSNEGPLRPDSRARFSCNVASRLVLGTFALVACVESAPIGYERDADPDALTDDEEVAPVDIPPLATEVELCTLPGTDDLASDEYIIQIRNAECSTSVCIHYNLETFCTHRCGEDADCADIIQGLCEVEIALGDPDITGRYCVPAQFSRY